MNKIKSTLKCYPMLYNALIYWYSPILHTAKEKRILANLVKNGTILNLGAGTKRYGKNVINVDLDESADLVCDISELPYDNDSIDGIICEMTLEHTMNPADIILEMHRVLKSKALVYIAIPFLCGFHESPHDYYRWTIHGVRELCKSFNEIEVGIRGGATSALCWIFQEWIAIALSFNMNWLYSAIYFLIGFALIPVKFLDLILSQYSNAHKIASGFYFYGSK